MTLSGYRRCGVVAYNDNCKPVCYLIVCGRGSAIRDNVVMVQPYDPEWLQEVRLDDMFCFIPGTLHAHGFRLCMRTAIGPLPTRLNAPQQPTQVLHATALDTDLAALPAGDLTSLHTLYLCPQVLHATALDTDLAALPAGDLTRIGDRGSTLSGGQRQR